MVCNSCGRNTQNEKANFCDYCGASFREVGGLEVRPSYNYSHEHGTGNASAPMSSPMPSEAIRIKQDEKPVSFLDWLGTYLIRFIPFVGQLVFFVMLIIWSIGNNVSESKRNWARAKLVYSIVRFIILILFLFLIISVVAGDPEFMDIWNTEMNQYNDLLNNYR